MKNILITGGAGYIGSHMAKALVCEGYNVTSIDNFSSGHLVLAKYGNYIRADLSDVASVRRIVSSNKFDSVIHFAGSSIVSQSMVDPASYFENNTVNTINLLNILVGNGISNFVFSSSAATYGEPLYTPIDELHPQKPINAYGLSKLLIEMVLPDYYKAFGLNSIALRYFNACGADPALDLGEMHEPETHLIPIVLQAASGRRQSVNIFGTDYPTFDGTCIRDYIHVSDICSAHILAMKKMLDASIVGTNYYNLGNGLGFSVKEVIDSAKKIVGREGYTLKVQEQSRRFGDPAILVADSSRAKHELNWRPMYSELSQIVSHAWEWEKKISGLTK